ncbi:hypothetical protein [Thermotalea metallivorans]|uniref:Uncharacterized protein n=1 Tax=Thermotalea metallivorans TaxID=520762 RepID=A0A140L1Q6_9FIRM|nr:hypothetical protein [Thermotalea metallivorans]KXG74481.1 hypothetical protein AN619_23270 [Thermotalea metallivorans]
MNSIKFISRTIIILGLILISVFTFVALWAFFKGVGLLAGVILWLQFFILVKQRILYLQVRELKEKIRDRHSDTE